jgi:hypothetical protein
MLILK